MELRSRTEQVMSKRLLCAALAAAAAAGIGLAAQSSSTLNIPVRKASPTDGRQMYVSYCAPCHGIDGRGHGPVAASLRVPPPDLTQFSRDNQGKFPVEHIISVLRFGASTPAHGTSAMPVWGPIFTQADMADTATKTLRINNLSLYLKSIQAK